MRWMIAPPEQGEALTRSATEEYSRKQKAGLGKTPLVSKLTIKTSEYVGEA